MDNLNHSASNISANTTSIITNSTLLETAETALSNEHTEGGGSSGNPTSIRIITATSSPTSTGPVDCGPSIDISRTPIQDNTTVVSSLSSIQPTSTEE